MSDHAARPQHPHAEMLLDRDTFRASVLARDKHACVECGAKDSRLDAHHIIERRLFTAEGEQGGYFLSNGATLCDDRDDGTPGCHRRAEQTLLSPDHLRERAGIRTAILPDGAYDGIYTKWLDPVMPDGRRGMGPLFEDLSVQQVLRAGGVLDLYTAYVKYSRTWHLPTSPGRTKDDRVHAQVPFAGRTVVATLKMDGENTTIYSDGFVHARSLDGATHPSQTWVRNLAGKIGYELDPMFRACGENLYARHAIRYDDLKSYFYLFNIWDAGNTCLAWDDVVLWAEILDVPVVPVLYRGPWNEKAIAQAFLAYQAVHGEQEGWVARVEDAFHYADFRQCVGKWVRKDHVAATVHNWRSGWYPSATSVNKLAGAGDRLLPSDQKEIVA